MLGIAGLIALLVVGCKTSREAGEIARQDRPSAPTASPAGAMSPLTQDARMTPSTPSRKANRLAHATSPYLLQHAYNPVDWYEWGPEALDKARREDKPIFLSIGYSACHWCHVMERESFENEEIAAFLNAHFVPIKVDREERPDLDDIYMMATQALTRSGGWPMSVWLTPELKPFYAGTYFPPDDRYGRPGFQRVLEFLADIWKNQREKALDQADQLTLAVQQLTTVAQGKDMVPWEAVQRAAVFLTKAFDPVKGGMSGGGTNKFPPTMAMDLMLRVYHASQESRDGSKPEPDARMLAAVELTLEKMAHGGIYDQLGGGFARYSTDVDWLVPHFEKMLYDQALVSDIYLKAFQLTGKPLYGRIARETLDYVIADLQSPEGGYSSSRDADSEGHEGKFYVWTLEEVKTLLGGDAALFCDYYDVTRGGNWEGVNILNIQRPLETVAKLHRLEIAEAEERLAAARRTLCAAREKRVKPHLDDKVLSSWNGMMIASMARGARILGDDRYRVSAEKAADFVMSRMVREGRLLRTYRAGKAHTHAYLDDHACLIEAMLNLYETTFDTKWLDHAEKLNDDLTRFFRDADHGAYYYTPVDGEKLIVRAKDNNDGATPSGNSVQLMNLLRLAVVLDRKDLHEEAERMIRAFSKHLDEAPFRSERMLAAIDFYHRRPRELAFVAASADTANLDKLIATAWRTYVPNVVFARIVVDAPGADDLAKRIPLLAAKQPPPTGAAAFVCRNFTCKAPTSDAEQLRALLAP